MIYKNSILILSMLFTQIISTTPPDDTIIEMDEENSNTYVKQQQNQRWAKYDEITDCCFLTTLCLPGIAAVLEPLNIINDEISLLGVCSAGAFMLAIDRYNQRNIKKRD